jgi:chorismate mutase/prephenate dehydratase
MAGGTDFQGELKKLREAIDRIDERLLSLINERAEIARRIGELKGKNAEAIFDPEREEEILKRLEGANPGPLRPQEVRGVFARIIQICRGMESSGRVAYLGPEGTFSHLALLKGFGAGVKAVPARELPEIAELLAGGEVDLALFPVENSTEGIVGSSYDLIVEHRFRIVQEIILPVHIYIIGRVELKRARRLYSHPQPFRQGYRFIARNLPGVEWVETRSSAEAKERLKQDPEGVALVSPLIAESGEFPILAGPIETQRENETRFWVVDRGEGEAGTPGEKTTLYFVLAHRPGTLARFLNKLARARINLTAITSRPYPGRSWEYRFFVDLEGDARREPIRSLLPALERLTVELKVLGSYPVVAFR